MVSDILGRLPVYEAKKVLVKDQQNTNDIIKQLLINHELFAKDYDKISDQFWKGSPKKTAAFIFDFLKKNVRYNVEPETLQTVKSPAAILASGKLGKNDCKHYASFGCGIVDSLKRKGKKISCFYRFSNYRLFTKDPQHVFCVVLDGDKEIWMDPVLDKFNYKKEYFNCIDKKPKNMALYKISGFTNIREYPLSSIGKMPTIQQIIAATILKNKAAGLPATLTPNQIIQLKTFGAAAYKENQEAKQARKDRWKNPFQKISLLPARNAFLALVGLNIFNLAHRIAHNLGKPQREAELKKRWQKAGGDYRKLRSTILHGIKKGRHQNFKYEQGIEKLPAGVLEKFYEVTGKQNPNKKIGAAPVVAAAAVPALYSTAAPVIGILGSLIAAATKIINTGTKVSNAIQPYIKQAQDIRTTYDQAKDIFAKNPQYQQAAAAAARGGYDAPPSGGGSSATEFEPTAGDGTGFDFKKLLLPAAAVAAIMFISKK